MAVDFRATLSCQLEELKALHEVKPTNDDKWRAHVLRKGEC